jgi:hypothetical protein
MKYSIFLNSIIFERLVHNLKISKLCIVDNNYNYLKQCLNVEIMVFNF